MKHFMFMADIVIGINFNKGEIMQEEKREQELPHNLEAEQSVLCAMMIDSSAFTRVAEVMEADDFYREAHKVIFRAMLELWENSQPVDMNTIVDKLNEQNMLKNVGGLEYLVSLSRFVSTSGNVMYHAGIVKNKSQLRQLIKAGAHITEMAFSEDGMSEEKLTSAVNMVFDISNRQKNNNFSGIMDIAMKIADKCTAAMNKPGSCVGIPTGLKNLDEYISGLQPSDFIILAARPSMGKTTLALNIVQNVALRSHWQSQRKEPYSVAIFSLEMSKEQLVSRMICSEGGINSQRFRIGALEQEEWDRMFAACQLLSDSKIYIDDTAGVDIMSIRRKAKSLKAEHGLDLIVIDYIQLIEGSNRGKKAEGRQQQISEISRSLKMLGRELSVPVLALSQLSRSVESREVKRPMLSDLRESGSLEQDADIVAFIYRPERYDPKIENPVAELIIEKHRNGPVGTVHLKFDGATTTFRDYEDDKKKS